MTLAPLSVFVDDLKRWEGVVPHMYLDTHRDTAGNPAPLVTVGIGSMLPNVATAIHLPFTLPYGSGRRPATGLEVENEYLRVKRMPFGHSASFYRSDSSPVLSQGDIAALTERRLIEEFLPELDSLGVVVKLYPLPAQRAVVDMAWNLGVAKLGRLFPSFCGACRSRNWAMAALECHRATPRPERNDWTRQLFEEAANGPV